MNDLLRLRLTAQLARDEGRRAMMYEDSLGIETIGIGHSLRRPISDRAIEQIFADDIADTERELLEHAPWMADVGEARYGAFLNLAFNMGVAGLMGFHHMLAAARSGRWDDVSAHLLDSKYATQVGDRARRLATQLMVNEWQ